jgi:pyridoxine/pyridoxamine 5'-phosphate oxidase
MTGDADEFAAMARAIIDANNYLTLATADESGRPWATPVYFTPHRYTDFYWVSSPEARHSRNLAQRPDVGIVVFDSQVPIGGAEAVYVTARVEQVAGPDLARCAEIFSGRRPEVSNFGPEDLQAAASLRLYRATASELAILLRGRDPRNSSGIDSRVTVPLPL